MPNDPHAATALELLRIAPSPAVAAALVPLAAPAFHGSGDFPVRLDPADSRRLAVSPTARVRHLVAYLTDDPDTLSALALSQLDSFARSHVTTHPALPVEALVRMGPPGFEPELYLRVLRERLEALVPTVDLLTVALESGNGVAVRVLLSHPDLTVTVLEAVQGLLPDEPRQAGDLYGVVSGRDDLPALLGRSVVGAPPSRQVLARMVGVLADAAPPGVQWFDPGAGSVTRLLHSLLEHPDLGYGDEVDLDLVGPLLHRDEFRKELLARTDLSAAVVLRLAELFSAELGFQAGERGLTLEAVLGSDELHWSDRQLRDGHVHRMLQLAKNPSCPLEVLAAIPASPRNPGPLARLLPDDPRVWEVAAALLADSPRVTFGELAATASGLVS